jgi:CBS domain-containing protein
MTVGDVCTRLVVTATADETIADAAKRMRDCTSDVREGDWVCIPQEERDGCPDDTHCR